MRFHCNIPFSKYIQAASIWDLFHTLSSPFFFWERVVQKSDQSSHSSSTSHWVRSYGRVFECSWYLYHTYHIFLIPENLPRLPKHIANCQHIQAIESHHIVFLGSFPKFFNWDIWHIWFWFFIQGRLVELAS